MNCSVRITLLYAAKEPRILLAWVPSRLSPKLNQTKSKSPIIQQDETVCLGVVWEQLFLDIAKR